MMANIGTDLEPDHTTEPANLAGGNGRINSTDEEPFLGFTSTPAAQTHVCTDNVTPDKRAENLMAATDKRVDTLKAMLGSLSGEFTDYRENIAKKIAQLHKSLQTCFTDSVTHEQLETQIDSVKDYVDTEQTCFVRRLEDMESRIAKFETEKKFDPEVTIIAQYIEKSNDEIIMDKALDFVKNGLKSSVNIVRAMRLTTRGRAPGLLKIEVPSLNEKISLLRRREKLSESDTYCNVKIRSSKSHTDRLIEINTDMILQELGLDTKMFITANGRLVYRDGYCHPYDNRRPIQ